MQIQELAQLQEWTAKQPWSCRSADAAIKILEADRVRPQGTQMNLERNAVQAMRDAIGKQSDDIGRQTVNAFAAPLQEMKQAAGFVRQSLKDVSWLLIGLMVSAGLVLGSRSAIGR